MLIQLGNLGKPFLPRKTYIYKRIKRIENNHYTENHIQELHDKKV